MPLTITPSRPRDRPRFGAGLALLALLGAGAEAQQPVAVRAGASSAFAAPAEKLYSLYDHAIVDDVASGLAEFLQLNAALPGSVAPATVDATEALRRLRGLFAARGYESVLESLAGSPPLATREALEAAAFGYFAEGRTAEALACLLVAAERAPRDPAALLNLASAALAYRKANEALALISEAGRHGPLPAAAWGMSGTHLADYLRAYALMLRGEYAESRRLLLSVVDAEPNLREAALTLALVESQLGASPRRPFLLGAWRQRGKLVVLDPPEEDSGERSVGPPDPFTDGNSIAPSMASLFDLSQGKPGRLPSVARPATPEELMGMTETYAEAMLEAMDYAAVLHNDVAGPAALAFEYSDAPAAYKRRMTTIYSRAVTRFGDTPEIDEAARRRDGLRAELDALTDKVSERARADQEPVLHRLRELMGIDGRPTPAESKAIVAQLNATTQGAIDEVSPVLIAYHAALEEEWTLRSSFMHGMLAHLGPATLRTALIAEAESQRLIMHVDQLSAVLNLAPAIGEFVDPAAAELDAGEKGEGPACSDSDANWSVSADVEVASVELSCNSVSVEVEPVKLPFLSLSMELGIDTSGTVTAFAGPKVSAAGVGSIKEGLFVTSGRNGKQDFGGKTETKRTYGVGPVTVNRKVSDSAFSFVPGPEPPGPLPPFGD